MAKLLAERAKEYPNSSGIDNNQMPAIAAVPPLFAAGCSRRILDAAVAITNLNAEAADAAAALFAALTAIADRKDVRTARRQLQQSIGGWIDFRPVFWGI